MMTYYEWKKAIIVNYQSEKEHDMRQFGIQVISDIDDSGKELICSSIYGTNNNAILKNALGSAENVAIIVGFGGNTNLHLGHLLLSNELRFYLNKINNPKFYFVNFDADEDKSFVNKIKLLSEDSGKSMDYEIIDYKNLAALKLRRKIAQSLNINTVNRVMGWQNENMQSYEKTLDMLTTFSLGSILQEHQSIILTDINQKTYYALYKQIENRISNQDTCFVYHLLIPSLKSPTERMSIKNPKSLIYLDDSNDEIENKLKKSYSGVENKETTCSILRVADLLLSDDKTMRLVNNCINTANGCKNCKANNITMLSNEIIKRRTRR